MNRYETQEPNQHQINENSIKHPTPESSCLGHHRWVGSRFAYWIECERCGERERLA